LEVKITTIEELQPGEMIGITQQGKNILISNVNGEYFAIGNNCTHLGCLLSNGILDGDRVECPCKGSVFDVKTGAVLTGPAEAPEPAYELKIKEGQVILVM